MTVGTVTTSRRIISTACSDASRRIPSHQLYLCRIKDCRQLAPTRTAAATLAAGRFLRRVRLGHTVEVGGGLESVDPVVADAVRDGGQDVLALVQGGHHEAVVALHVALFNLKLMRVKKG